MVGETLAMAPDVFLRELWYMPALASSLRPGDMRSEMLLGDRPDDFLPYGVMICGLVGAIGGLFGQYAAWIRAFNATLRR